MNEDISKAISVFRRSPNSTDEDVYRQLVVDGVGARRAARLVEFLPIVYCRAILRNSGAKFTSIFRRQLPGGASEELPLTSDPVWTAGGALNTSVPHFKNGTKVRIVPKKPKQTS